MVEGIAYHLGDFVEAYWSDKDMGKELREMFNRPAWKATHSNVITEVSPRGDLKNFYLPLWKFKHDKTTKNGRLAPGLALPPVLPHSLEMDLIELSLPADVHPYPGHELHSDQELPVPHESAHRYLRWTAWPPRSSLDPL